MKNLTEYKIKVLSNEPFSDFQKLEFIRNMAARLEGGTVFTPDYVRGAEMTISLIRKSNEKIRTSDEKIVSKVEDMYVDKEIIETTKFVQSQDSINEIKSLKKELKKLEKELEHEKNKLPIIKEIIVKKLVNRKTKRKNAPDPPLDKVIIEGITHFCDICGSTMSKNGFLGLFGKRTCDNDKCENSKIKKED